MSKQAPGPAYHVVFVPPYPNIMTFPDAEHRLNLLESMLKVYHVGHPFLYDSRRRLKPPAACHVIRHVVTMLCRHINPLVSCVSPKNIRVQRQHNGAYHVSLRVQGLKRWCPLMLVEGDYKITAILYDLDDTSTVKALYDQLGLRDAATSLRASIANRDALFQALCHDAEQDTANGHDVRCRMSEGLSRLSARTMRHLVRHTRHIHYICSATIASDYIETLWTIGAIRYTTLAPEVVDGILREVDAASERALRLVRHVQGEYVAAPSDGGETSLTLEIESCRAEMLEAQRVLDMVNTAATAHRALDVLEHIMKQRQLTKATGAVLCRRT